MIRECYQLADLLTGTEADGSAQSVADYRFSDTSYQKFGEVVPHTMVRDPTCFVARGAAGLVKIEDDDGDEEWTSVDKVLPKDLDAWTDEKRHGPGRDPRVLAIQGDARDVRFRPLRAAIGDFTFPDPKDRPPD